MVNNEIQIFNRIKKVKELWGFFLLTLPEFMFVLKVWLDIFIPLFLLWKNFNEQDSFIIIFSNTNEIKSYFVLKYSHSISKVTALQLCKIFWKIKQKYCLHHDEISFSIIIYSCPIIILTQNNCTNDACHQTASCHCSFSILFI